MLIWTININDFSLIITTHTLTSVFALLAFAPRSFFDLRFVLSFFWGVIFLPPISQNDNKSTNAFLNSLTEFWPVAVCVCKTERTSQHRQRQQLMRRPDIRMISISYCVGGITCVLLLQGYQHSELETHDAWSKDKQVVSHISVPGVFVCSMKRRCPYWPRGN